MLGSFRHIWWAPGENMHHFAYKAVGENRGDTKCLEQRWAAGYLIKRLKGGYEVTDGNQAHAGNWYNRGCS